jgi:parallel beta-helix repeat protein
MAIGLTSANAAPPMQPPSDGDIPPGKPAAWDVVESHAPGLTAAPARVAASPIDCLGAPARQIRYTSDGVIHLEGCGQTFTLSQVAAAPAVGPTRLELVDPANKIWLLKVKLKVEEGATLRLIGGAGGDTNWLRLRSDAAGGIWLRAENGNLILRNTKVTSWDTARNTYDTDVSVASNGTGGRSYIAARSVLKKGRPTALPTACDVNGGSQEPYEARMDVIDSQIAYLGYNAAESYGLAWKVYYKTDPTDPTDQPPPGRQLYAMVDIFGDATGSVFEQNYFGSYTYGAYCMTWSGNAFTNNVQYGLDPHDDSDYITIAGNTFRDNGNHGVICSVECDHLVIANNESYRNQHGIMVHRNSNGAWIEGNTVYDNRGAGIAIFDSHDALVRANVVTNNVESAVRLSVGSSRNLIENNRLTGLAASRTGSGYVVYTYKGSDPPTPGDGRPKNNIFRNNQLAGYKSQLLKIGDATGNLFEGNTIGGSANTFAFSRAPNNTIRDGEVGKAIRITLDATSTVTLKDSRSYVWMLSRSGLSATAGADEATLKLTSANTGGSVSVTTLALGVRPSSGSIAVQPTSWQTSARSWTEFSSDVSGAVPHIVGDLQAGDCYDVRANNQALGRFRADGAGRIDFAYAGGYSSTVAFALTRSSGCVAVAPEHRVLLSLIRR